MKRKVLISVGVVALAIVTAGVIKVRQETAKATAAAVVLVDASSMISLEKPFGLEQAIKRADLGQWEAGVREYVAAYRLHREASSEFSAAIAEGMLSESDREKYGTHAGRNSLREDLTNRSARLTEAAERLSVAEVELSKIALSDRIPASARLEIGLRLSQKFEAVRTPRRHIVELFELRTNNILDGLDILDEQEGLKLRADSDKFNYSRNVYMVDGEDRRLLDQLKQAIDAYNERLKR